MGQSWKQIGPNIKHLDCNLFYYDNYCVTLGKSLGILSKFASFIKKKIFFNETSKNKILANVIKQEKELKVIQIRKKKIKLSFADKESDCNTGDQRSISGSERFSGEGNGYPVQYSCLENPMDRGA